MVKYVQPSGERLRQLQQMMKELWRPPEKQRRL
jgi:hypothetical protein